MSLQTIQVTVKCDAPKCPQKATVTIGDFSPGTMEIVYRGADKTMAELLNLGWEITGDFKHYCFLHGQDRRLKPRPVPDLSTAR